MLKRFRLSCNNCFIAVKQSFCRNKIIFILCGVAAVLGLILSFTRIGDAVDNYNGSNIISDISNGEFSFIGFYLKLLLLTSLLYFIGLILSVNSILFLLNLPIILLYCRFFFRSALISCIAGGAVCYLLILFFYIPIILINWLIFSMYLAEIYQICVCGCRWKYITPIKCNWHATSKLLKKFIILSIALNVIYTAVIFIFLAIIF